MENPFVGVNSMDTKEVETKEQIAETNNEKEEEEGSGDGTHGSTSANPVIPELNLLMVLYAVSSTSGELLHSDENNEERHNGRFEAEASIGRTTIRRREKNEFKVFGQRRPRFQPRMKNMKHSRRM
ncbi:uncharacterized protein LOC122060892 [Macadamia integrifolia]|uniref:uncharacterized protein LOC122060892 n=1 Tax=Macadamia integrifolia TaxID=60698 RepID=UPI001C52EF66|nr:uncharacterized protein LOC122060892 [Macadamia integrifolia]